MVRKCGRTRDRQKEMDTKCYEEEVQPYQNHPFSNHTYTKSTSNHFHHHYAPFVTHTTHIISSTAPTYVPRCHPRICGQTRRSDGTACQMDGEAGWWTTSRNIGSPPHWQRSREWADNNPIRKRTINR